MSLSANEFYVRPEEIPSNVLPPPSLGYFWQFARSEPDGLTDMGRRDVWVQVKEAGNEPLERSELQISYRLLRAEDINLCFAWANTPEVVKYLPSMPKPLSWEQHKAWAWKAIRGENRTDFMINIRQPAQLPELPVLRCIGRVHVTNLRGVTPEVGVMIGDEEMWGKGIATAAIDYMLRWMIEHGPWYQCFALIHPENIASQHAFEKNGFVRDISQDHFPRGGQQVWVRELHQ